ncbi:MAG: hypothetical protein N3D18_13185 [Roseococcus sp.]|nr:hypothetical protein [Roseococcus sp.]
MIRPALLLLAPILSAMLVLVQPGFAQSPSRQPPQAGTPQETPAQRRASGAAEIEAARAARDQLRAARDAVERGRLREANDLLARAEGNYPAPRAPSAARAGEPIRGIDIILEDVPNGNVVFRQSRDALARGDRTTAISAIDVLIGRLDRALGQ